LASVTRSKRELGTGTGNKKKEHPSTVFAILWGLIAPTVAVDMAMCVLYLS